MAECPVRDSNLPTPPDGGWGWMVVLGSFFVHVVADGVAYSFGIYMVVFTQYFDGVGRSELGWIGSIMVGATLMSGPIGSALCNKFGCRKMTIFGTFIASFGFFVSFFVNNVYVLYLTLGVIAGTGLGILYLPAIVILSFYFEKKRAFATGLAVCGSGVGTFVFAPLAEWLIDNYGWHGALLIESAILLNCCVSGVLFRPLQRKRIHKRSAVYVSTPTAVSSQPVTTDPTDNPDSHTTDTDGQHAVNDLVNQETTGPAIRLGDSKEVEPVSEGATGPVLLDPVRECSTSPANKTDDTKTPKDKPKECATGPVTRMDAFYSASLHNIPLYRDDPEKFRKSMSRTTPDNASEAVRKSMSRTIPDNASEPFDFVKWSFWKDVVSVFDPSIIKDAIFQLFAWSNFFTNLAVFIPFVFLPDRAVSAGVDENRAAFLLSVIGIFNTLGRVAFGWLGDRRCINRLFLYCTVLTICGTITCLSALSNGFTLMALYAAGFGLLIGVYVTLTPIMIVDLLGLDKLSNAFGIVMLYQGVATIIGPPVAGFLFDKMGNYTIAFWVFGISIVISGLMLYPIPCLLRRRIKKYGPDPIALRLGMIPSQEACTN